MKITLHQIDSGENEVIVRYLQMDREVEDVIRAARGEIADGERILCSDGETKHILPLRNILYFRCSKSMIINIYRISRLQSESGGRINAVMENGEHVIISRSYAKEFRRVLRGEE